MGVCNCTNPYPGGCGACNPAPLFQWQWPTYVQPQQGWICPRCQRVHAPSVLSCTYCVTITVTSETSEKCPYSGNPIFPHLNTGGCCCE